MRGLANGTFLVAVAAIATLFLVGMESGHMIFANRGINVQTDTTQDQGCEPAGGTSGITNACTATSTPPSTQTLVTLDFHMCNTSPGQFNCNTPIPPNNCNNIGCTNISCAGDIFGTSNCTTNNGVQLTSCTGEIVDGLGIIRFSCTRTETGTGIVNSGGVTGSDAG